MYYIIKKILPKKFRQLIKSIILITISILYRIFRFQSKVNTEFELISIGNINTNTFFGYYDIIPFNSNDEIVYLELPNGSQKVNIIFNDSTLKNPKLITTTNAWNWQQGSRLRWFPCSDNKIVFNDFINDKYVCRILDVRNNENKIIDSPIYDISSDGKYGVTLNFERLGVLRPGYGYTNKPYYNQYDLSEESIRLIDMDNGKEEIILSYKDIVGITGQNVENYENFYINHLSFSPDGKKIMFFWLEIVNSWHKSSLLVYNLNDKKTTVLENELKISHYAWESNDSLLCTGYSNHLTGNNSKNSPIICRFYMYNIINKSKNIVYPEFLQWDGHPIYLSKNIILTDTYPNRYSYQKLFLLNLATKEKTKLLEIYSAPRKKEEERTDLHPRLNKSKNIICFDANVYGKRRLYFLKGWK
jgi:hypothetical protein